MLRKVPGHLIMDGSVGTYRKVWFYKQCPGVADVRSMEHLTGRCSWAEDSLWTGPKEREIGANSAELFVPSMSVGIDSQQRNGWHTGAD